MKKYVKPEMDVQILLIDKSIAALDRISTGDGDGAEFEDM